MLKFDFNPVSPEIYTITHSSTDKIEGEMWLGKGNAGPPLHYHPKIQEDLELISGKLKIYSHGKWETITAGTKWTIPPNEVHTFKTIPDSDATVKFCATPALGFEGFSKRYPNIDKNKKINFL